MWKALTIPRLKGEEEEMVLVALELEKQDYEVEFSQCQKHSIKTERKQRNILNCLLYSLGLPLVKPN